MEIMRRLETREGQTKHNASYLRLYPEGIFTHLTEEDEDKQKWIEEYSSRRHSKYVL